MGHAKERILQPSNLERTLNCSGWGNYCRHIPDDPPGDYALEGTLEHDIGSQCLTGNISPDKFNGVTASVSERGEVHYGVASGYYVKTIDQEMVDHAAGYVEYVRSLIRPGSIVKIEEILNLESVAPGMFGTGDAIVINPLENVDNVDLKYGQGIAVEVSNNPQLMAYALGAVGPDNPYMVESVNLTIYQPRKPHPNGPIRSRCYSVGDLYEWANSVLVPGINAARNPAAPLKAGKWCKWCPGAKVYQDKICPEFAGTALAPAVPTVDQAGMPTQVRPPDAPTMTSDQIDRVLGIADRLEAWIKVVRLEGYRRLEHGRLDAPRGYKLVPGRKSNRKWGVGPVEVYNAVKTIIPRDEVFKESIVSPAQLEKALKRRKSDIEINPLLAPRKDGKPSMVPVDDPGQAIQPAHEMFKKEI